MRSMDTVEKIEEMQVLARFDFAAATASCYDAANALGIWCGSLNAQS